MMSGYSASKMIAPKVVVRMLTLFLLISCSSLQSSVRGASFFEQQQASGATEFPYGQLADSEFSLIEPTQERQQQQLPQAVDENLSQDNLKENYLMKDLDLEGYSQRQQSLAEKWKLIRLSQLLDSLSSSIPTGPTPTQSAIYRGGRTLPALAASLASNGESNPRHLRLAPSGNGRFDSADPQQQQLLFVQPAEILEEQGVLEKDFKTRRPTVLGIAWPPTNKRRSQAIASGSSKGSQQLHRFGTEEVASNTPMHPRLNTDSESKRVENHKSNWHKLSGWWRKRAAANGEPPHFNGGGNAASNYPRAASLQDIQR